MPSTSTLFHAREVIEMLHESGKLYTRDSLAAAITERFGSEARFQTCAGEELSALRLVEHLAVSGKLVRFAGGFAIDREKLCRHE